MKRLIAVASLLVLAVPASAAAKAVQCRVPNLKGKTVVQARQKLTAAHCKVGAIHTPIEANGRPTIILSQRPAAGAKEKAKYAVRLYLEVKPVPPVGIPGTQTIYDDDAHPITATVTSITNPATGSDEFNQPDPGDYLIAVQLELADAGNATVSDDANSDVTVFGSDNQTYTPNFDTVTGCTDFAYGSFTLAPGTTASGCVVFEMPLGVNPQQVQFTLDNGVGIFNAS
jgi:hypothetical protein